MTIDISRMFSGQFGFPGSAFPEPKLNSTFPEAKVSVYIQSLSKSQGNRVDTKLNINLWEANMN